MSFSPVQSPRSPSLSPAEPSLLPVGPITLLDSSTSVATFQNTVAPAQAAAAAYVEETRAESPLKEKGVILLPNTEAEVMAFVQEALKQNSENDLPAVEDSAKEPASPRVEPSDGTDKPETNHSVGDRPIEESQEESAVQLAGYESEESEEGECSCPPPLFAQTTSKEEQSSSPNPLSAPLAQTTSRKEELRLNADESIVDFLLREETGEIFPGSKDFIATLSNLDPALKREKLKEWVANLEIDAAWDVAVGRAIQSGKTDLLWDIVHSDSLNNKMKQDKQNNLDLTLLLSTVQKAENVEMFKELVTWDRLKNPSIKTLNALIANTFSAENIITEDRDKIFQEIMKLPDIDKVSGDNIQKPLLEAATEGYWDVVEKLWKLPHSADKLSSADLDRLSALAKANQETELARSIYCVKAARFARHHALAISSAAVAAILAAALGSYKYSQHQS